MRLAAALSRVVSGGLFAWAAATLSMTATPACQLQAANAGQTPCPPNADGTPGQCQVELTLLHTADIHSRLLPYDLLITDLKMPGVDGLTVIREARRLKADLPVIIITGYSNEASAIEAVNLGVSGYLTKPFRVPRVLAAASKALGE